MSSGEKQNGETYDDPMGAATRRGTSAESHIIYPLALMESAGVINPDTATASDRGKRKREDTLENAEGDGLHKITVREAGEGSGSKISEPNLVGGAVGPEPPLPS